MKKVFIISILCLCIVLSSTVAFAADGYSVEDVVLINLISNSSSFEVKAQGMDIVSLQYEVGTILDKYNALFQNIKQKKIRATTDGVLVTVTYNEQDSKSQDAITMYINSKDELRNAAEILALLRGSACKIVFSNRLNVSPYDIETAYEYTNELKMSVFAVDYNYYQSNKVSYMDLIPMYAADDLEYQLLKEKISEIGSKIFAGKTDVEDKVAAVNEYIVKNYDYKDTLANIDHSAAGLINNGYGVCQGYANMAAYLLKYAGVPVRYVYNDDHAWLMVQYEDGTWYHFDPTFNDPIYKSTINRPEVVITKYNKMTDSELMRERSWNYSKFTNYENNYAYEKYGIRRLTLNNGDFIMNWNGIDIKIANTPKERPMIINGHIVVPLDFAQKYIGAICTESDDTVTFTRLNKTIVFNLKDRVVSANGKQLQSYIVSMNGFYYVTLNPILDEFGYTYTVKGKTATITIKNAF